MWRRNLEAKLYTWCLNGKVTLHIPRMHRDQNHSSPHLPQILPGIYYMNKLETSKNPKPLFYRKTLHTVHTELCRSVFWHWSWDPTCADQIINSKGNTDRISSWAWNHLMRQPESVCFKVQSQDSCDKSNSYPTSQAKVQTIPSSGKATTTAWRQGHEWKVATHGLSMLF